MYQGSGEESVLSGFTNLPYYSLKCHDGNLLFAEERIAYLVGNKHDHFSYQCSYKI